MPSSPWSSTGSGASTTPSATTALVNPHLTDPDWLCVPAKAQVITNYNAELQVQTQLQAGAAACTPAVSTSAYDAAVAGLTTFLDGLTNNPSGNPAWSSSAGDTYLGAGGGATLQTKWAAVAQQRTILGTSIGQAQATKASNDAISAAAADASTKVSNALTQAANDATTKAAAMKQEALTQAAASAGLMAGTPLYLKGTGYNRSANRSVKLGSAECAVNSRGLLLVWVRRSDLAVIGQTGYDTYASAEDRAALTSALDALSDAYLVCLASYDAIGWDANLISAVNRCGGNVPTDAVTGRTPYALVGIPGVGKGRGLQAFSGTGATDPYAEISTHLLSGGTPVGMSSVAAIVGEVADAAMAAAQTADNNATTKSAAAQAAAQAYADLKKTEAQAYADGIVTAEEQRAIADATAKYNAAMAAAQTAQATANTAQTMPTYANPAALPAASGFAPGYGPVLTLSDYSLWRVNSGATAWDRILFGAEGIFGKVTVDQLDVTDALRAAVVDAAHVKTQLLSVVSDATASGPGGAVQIGGGAIKAEAISVKHLVVGDFTNLCTNPSGERGLEGWTSIVTEAFDMGDWWGTAGLKCLKTTDRDSFFGQYINVTPGEVFAFSVEARPCNESNWPGQVPTAPFAVGLKLFSKPGTCVGFLPAASASYANPDWQTTKGQATVPVGAKLAVIWVQIEKAWGSPGWWTFRNLIVRRASSADMIVDGAITAQKLSATCASTSNFTQGTDDVNGGIYAAAGAAMVVNTPSTPALVTDAAGLKIGKRVFTDYWFRLLNAIDGSYSGGILVWRGNNDTTVRNGASNIDCLDLVISNVGDNALLRWRLKPTSLTDNLDGMHQLRAQVFPGVGGATPGLTIYPELRDRYYVTANHGDAANEVIGDAFYGQLFKVLGTSYWYNGFVGHLLVDISNSYGWSAQRWYHSTASGWYTRDSTAPAGAPAAGGSSAGGSLGGGCPAPWVPVLLASGLEVQAGSLRDGMTVVGVDDCTGAPSVGVLRGVERRWVHRVRVVLEDGRAPEFTATHRLGTVEGGWCEAQHLAPGQLLAAQRESRVRAVEAAGQGQVVSFEVEGCHTYFAGGLLSHNYKAGTI